MPAPSRSCAACAADRGVPDRGGRGVPGDRLRAARPGAGARAFSRRSSDDEIEHYLRIEQPYDCAGSAKSEGLGIALLDAIDSDDPTALVGLPLIRTCRMLRAAGIERVLMSSRGALYLVPAPLDFGCAQQVPLHDVLPAGTLAGGRGAARTGSARTPSRPAPTSSASTQCTPLAAPLQRTADRRVAARSAQEGRPRSRPRSMPGRCWRRHWRATTSAC